MNTVVLDIETKNIFSDVGSNDPAALDISVVCTYSYATDSYQSFLEEEFPKLWPVIEKADTLVGFNSDHFDIPLLNKYYGGDLTHIKSIDILGEIRKALGRRVSLDQVAEGTLGRRKSGHGLLAIEWWKKGDISSLRKYCTDDVKITKEIYDYARENGKLKFKEAGQIFEVKLDTSLWEEKKNKAMTFSLPF